MSYLGNTPGVSSQRFINTYTATAGQTTFTATSGYSLGYIDVYLNGVKLSNSGADYTASNGTSITLIEPAALNDIVELVAYLPRGLSDGYLKTESDSRYIRNDVTTGIVRDTAGNLGLGVTPSAWYTNSKVFQFGTGGSIEGRDNNPLAAFASNSYIDTSGNYKYLTTNSATRYYQTSGQHIWQVAASGTAGNAISFTQAMTLDVSGNLGLGATSITTSRFQIKGANNLTAAYDDGLKVTSNNETVYTQYNWNGINGSGNLLFATGGSERARIDSSGNLLVGTTGGSSRLEVFAGNQIGLGLSNGNTSDLIPVKGNRGGSSTSAMYVMPMRFGDDTLRGGIYWNGTSVAYQTSSDYRLKEDVQPMTGALAKVAALKPCTYKWKVNGSDGQGFIAHELQAVVPDAVVGEKDAVDAEGKPIYQGIDTSFLVATLTAAIQEQQAIIEQLNQRIITLENKL